MAFRNPKFVERNEDVVFDLETPLVTAVANNAHQTKTGYRFVADNSGEVAPFDWYNARFVVDFKVNKLADGADIAANDHNGIVNSAHSFIRELTVKGNGIQLYDCAPANHAVNIKTLLEYSPAYAKQTATNEFFYLDTSRSAEERSAQAAYNKGFAGRKTLLGTSATVTAEIPLNRYSFFEALETKLLPNMKVELGVTLESDANLIWQAADDCRVIITKFQLWVPRLVFNEEGTSLYTSQFLKPQKWTYLRENIERGNSTRQQTGSFRITSGISRPRHVFVWISNDARQNAQTQNPFLYDTFSVANNRTLTSCHLEVGNGEHYPETEFTPSTDMSRVFRAALGYVHANNDFAGASLLTRARFSTLASFIYFDLQNQKAGLRDGTTKLTFRYKLSGGTNADYSVYALVLYEQDVELIQSSGKLLIRS